jgi:signal transduction histidine kinase
MKFHFEINKNGPLFFSRRMRISLILIFCFVFVLFQTTNLLYAARGKTIIVGGNEAYPPYEFIDPDGYPTGYNVDLTKAIADLMGMEVEFRLGNWSEIRNALETGEVDVLQGMSYSDGRTKVADLSIAHTIVNHSVYARKGTPIVQTLESLEGKNVSFHGRGFIHDYLAERKIKVNPIISDTPAGALRLLAQGKSEYAVVASLPATYIINDLHLQDIVPVANSVVSVKYCYAVKKGNKELLSRLNEGLAMLKQTGQHQIIYDRWLGVLEPKGVPWGKVVTYGFALIIIFFIPLAGSLLWSRILKKQVAIRTAALEQEVHERKRAVEELKLRQSQLIQADKMASLGILVSGVAHEINNPNALILLNMPLVIDYYNDTRQIIDEYFQNNGDFMVAGLPYSRIQKKIESKLSDIQESAKKIKRIADDLKDFARRDEQEHTFQIDINSVIQAAIRLVEASINRSTKHFYTFFGSGLPMIKGNAQRIEQVFVNMILNACQALRSREEGIYIWTRHDEIRSQIVAEIRDEGEGVAKEDISHLTDPFFTTKRQQGGTGLGLSVSAGIIKEHQATLDFSSQAGEGMTVTLRFPIYKKEVSDG